MRIVRLAGLLSRKLTASRIEGGNEAPPKATRPGLSIVPTRDLDRGSGGAMRLVRPGRPHVTGRVVGGRTGHVGTARAEPSAGEIIRIRVGDDLDAPTTA